MVTCLLHEMYVNNMQKSMTYDVFQSNVQNSMLFSMVPGVHGLRSMVTVSGAGLEQNCLRYDTFFVLFFLFFCLINCLE